MTSDRHAIWQFASFAFLDEFLVQCTDVVGDDGLCFGQRTAEGHLQAQVSDPKDLPLPEDVDWKKH